MKSAVFKNRRINLLIAFIATLFCSIPLLRPWVLSHFPNMHNPDGLEMLFVGMVAIVFWLAYLQDWDLKQAQ